MKSPLRSKPKTPSWKQQEAVGSFDERKTTQTILRNYERARTLKNESLKERQKYDQQLKDEEKQRQESEKSKFTESFNKIEKEFQEKWNQIMFQVDQECQRKIEELRERQAVEMRDLKENLREKLKHARPRFSVKYADMKREEKELAKIENFEEAAIVRDRINKLEKEELKRNQEEQKRKKKKEIQRLKNKHEDQMRFLKMKNKNTKINMQHIRRSEMKKLKQQRHNLYTDMEHAHKMEFILQRETEATIENSRKTHRHVASTQGGSRLQQLTKQDALPSLCDMYGDTL
eukprot:gb/GECH01006337.1/.p1 GENE.gb/GECH01006337.1/~~gb/GECH01006337.1/.p1  ORF type:complete len:289 (+),score=96.22 gb/GECH01006337.1/:1-867(+)